MGKIMCIHIDTNKIMKLIDMVVVNYDGVFLGVGRGEKRKDNQLGNINDTDYLHCYVDSEKETDKNLSKAYEFLSCLSFQNRAIIVSTGSGGHGCNGFDLQRFKKRTSFLAWGRSIIPNIGYLEISCIPKIENKNQAIVLSLYREAMNSRSNFYQFLCLWKIIDLKYNQNKYKKDRNNMLKKYCDELIDKDRIKYWGMDKKELWNHLQNEYRNGIAHITKKPRLTTDDSIHLFKVACGANLLEEIIYKFIENEYDLREKKCLVLMPGETIPRYVTIKERFLKKDKFDEKLFDNYMKNEHKPYHNFADKEYHNI